MKIGYRHKETGTIIDFEKLMADLKWHGTHGEISIPSLPKMENFKSIEAMVKGDCKCSIEILRYKIIDIPNSEDFELYTGEFELTEDDYIDLLYELKNSRLRDKVYRRLKEVKEDADKKGTR